MKLSISFSLVCVLVLTAILMSCDSPSDSDEPLAPSELVVEPTTLAFDSTYVSKFFTIRNAGEAALTWAVEENLDWIMLDTDSGICLMECDTVRVIINIDGLSTGTLSGQITVTSNGGSDSVDISIVVPYLYDGQYCGRYVFATTESDGVFFVDWVMASNTYSMANSAGDVEGLCSPTGSFATYGTDSIYFTETSDGCEGSDDSGLNPAGVFTVRIQGDSLILRQHTDIALKEIALVPDTPETPILSVSPAAVDLGYQLDGQTLTIENTGTGTLEWYAAKNADWINFYPEFAYGTTTDEVDELVVFVNRDLLEGGDYVGEVTINSNGGYLALPVSVSKFAFVDMLLEGRYYFITNYGEQFQVTEQYDITGHFTQNIYYLWSDDDYMCDPGGYYTMINSDSLILDQLEDGCSGTSGDPERNPVGPFEIRQTVDSLILTQVSNDTCKVLRLVPAQ